MRTNKFIPFYIAVALHAIPLCYFLIKKPALPMSTAAPIQGIGLSGFSISNKTSLPKAYEETNPIKRVGLPAASVEAGPKSIGNINEVSPSTGSGAGAGNYEKNLNPKFISFLEPVYPPVARKKGWEGTVKIKTYFNQNGTVTNIDIIKSSGIKMLDESVRKAAMSWRLSTISSGSFEKSFED